MGRRGVEVIVELLDVLAMVALGTGEAEEALLEVVVLPVPEGHGQAEILETVADTAKAILVPAVGTARGLVVGEVAPGLGIGAVVFANRAPGAFSEVGTPFAPIGATGCRVGNAAVLGGAAPGHGMSFRLSLLYRERTCRQLVEWSISRPAMRRPTANAWKRWSQDGKARVGKPSESARVGVTVWAEIR